MSESIFVSVGSQSAMISDSQLFSKGFPAVEAIENEISKGTKIFYVGYHGNFDRMAIAALRQAKQKHDIVAALVLPYHPAAYHIEKPDGFDMILYPPLESVLPKYALVRANQYMVRTSGNIICYVRHFGNSRNLLEYAQRHCSSITNIS